MINFVTDHSVKLTLSWFESGLCRQTFAFFGSSPACVVEHLGPKLRGQNPDNCTDEPTQAHFTPCDDLDAPAKIFVLQCIQQSAAARSRH